MWTSALICTLVLLQSTEPQSSDPPPVIRQEIVVTASRGPEPAEKASGAVTVVKREEIDKRPIDSLGELLSEIPGFQAISSRAGTSGVPMISSRGFFGGGEVDYVQLLVDGVPLARIESGLSDWRRIRLQNVERVEVLRGPGSAVYGDSALGGVVQIFTDHSAGEGGAIRVGGGSFGLASLDLNLHNRDEKRGVTLSASAGHVDGFRNHSSSDDLSADVDASQLRGAAQLRFSLGFNRREREEPGALGRDQIELDRRQSDPFYGADEEDNDQARATFSLDRNAMQGSVFGSWRDARVRRTLLLAPGFPDSALRDLSTHSIGTTWQWGGELTPASQLRLGMDAGHDQLDTSYFDDVSGDTLVRDEARRRRLAAFLLGEWNASERIRVNGALRWDRISDRSKILTDATHQAWSPRIGMHLQLGSLNRTPVRLFISYARSFKAPTIDQLFDPRPFPSPAGGTFTISNPDLSPQRAKSFELGVAGSLSGIRWDVLGYRMNVDDEIDFDPSTFIYSNIGRSSHWGVETSVRGRIGARVQPRLAYTWTRVTPLQNEHRGRQLKNIAEHALTAGISSELGRGWAADLIARWTSGRFLDDANQFALDDTILIDARVRRSFGRLDLHVDVLNFLDDQSSEVGYVLQDFDGSLVPYEFPSPGFSVRAGLEWRFGATTSGSRDSRAQ